MNSKLRFRTTLAVLATLLMGSSFLPIASAQGDLFSRFRFFQRPAFGFCPGVDSVFRASIEREESGAHVFRASILQVRKEAPPEGGCIEDLLLDEPGLCAREVLLEPRLLSEVELMDFAALSMAIIDGASPSPHPLCGAIDPCAIHEFSWDAVALSDDPCAGPRLEFEATQSLIDALDALIAADDGSIRNGDVNGDGNRNIADAGYLLGTLFRKGPAPVAAGCADVLPCDDGFRVEVENGDANGDTFLDLSDVVYFLLWLFRNGPSPAPLCSCATPPSCSGCEPPTRCIRIGENHFQCTGDLNSCEAVEQVYETLVTTPCDAAVGCHVLWGQCGVGLGGCYHAVPRTVSQEALNALGNRFSELGCTSAVCDCALPPESASCAGSLCQFDDL